MSEGGFSPGVTGPIGVGMQIAGAITGGNAAASAGRAQQAAAEYAAKQLDVNAGQSQAASQQAAIEEARRSALLQSRALAVAGASGAGALDPTVLKIIGGIAAEGELASETQIYQGNERARAQRDQAAATRYEGQQRAIAGEAARRAAYLSSVGTIIGASSKSWNAPRAPITESVPTFNRP